MIVVLTSYVFITVYLSNGDVAKRIKAEVRVGPHNHDIMSIFYGALLGDSHAEQRTIGNGTRLSFSQEAHHSEYLL